MNWTPDNYTHNAAGHMVRQQAARERRGAVGEVNNKGIMQII